MGANLTPGHHRRNRRQSYQQFADINVTPLVDVMLVLLVIFMVTAPMMTAGVQVDLPESNASPVPGQDEPLTISIAANGRIYLQKTEIQIKELEPKLKAITGQKKDTRIFVRGDKSVDYGRIMQVVGEVNAAGLNRIALITEVATPTPAAPAPAAVPKGK